jgi:hypothetical protein
MMKHKIVAIGAGAFAVLLAVSIAAAQAPDVVRVRGTIVGVDGNILDVKSRDDTPIKVKLAGDVKVLAVDRKSLADVKQGVFVGMRWPSQSCSARVSCPPLRARLSGPIEHKNPPQRVGVIPAGLLMS